MQEEKQNNKIKKDKTNSQENRALAPVKEKKSFTVKKFFRRRHPHKQNYNNEQKMAQDFTKMLSKSIKIMIPWLIIPTIIFLIGAYFVFETVVFSYYTPLWFKIVFGIITFGFFLLAGILYGLFMGFVASLKVFSQNFGLLIRQAMNSLKNSIESKINSLSFDMFSKKELSNLISQTFSDFNYKIRKYAQKTALGFVAIGIISSILFFARHFIVRSLGVIKNKADAFALISARTSLIVAVILNLTLFTKIVLWLGTFLGVGILLLQALFVLYFR
jgi:ABC-type multidrug transport system fused ATPase/permease subunit